MAEVKLKQHQHKHSVELLQVKEESEPHPIKKEPEEFPFHAVAIKTEDDVDNSSVLYHRPTEENTEEINGSSSDTDHSEDYSQEQAEPKRSYAMIPADSCVMDHTPFTRSDRRRVRCSDHRPFSCTVCGKRCRCKSILEIHMRFHTGVKPYKCSVCEKSFQKKEGLKRHMDTHSRTPSAETMCSLCQQVFHFKCDFYRHLHQIHHICPVCETSFSDELTLNEHLTTHVGRRTLDPSFLQNTRCPDCGTRLKSNSHYWLYMLGHIEEMPHKCPVCATCFSHETELNEHLTSHEEMEAGSMKPYHCSYCGSWFTKKSLLRKHTLVHMGDRSHQCPVCDKYFTQKGLKSHMRTHTRDKPFSTSAFSLTNS